MSISPMLYLLALLCFPATRAFFVVTHRTCQSCAAAGGLTSTTTSRIRPLAPKRKPHKLFSSPTNTPQDLPPIPPPPKLSRAALPAMLAGGLFLFSKSVPSTQKDFARELLSQAENALRSDPTVSMELGMGIEAGGVYASSHAGEVTYGDGVVDQLVLQFQIIGGNAWAQGVAYGIQSQSEHIGKKTVKLLTLEVANMDAVLNNNSFQVFVPF